MTAGGLRVERITLREIRLALREPFEISSGRTTERRILLLELVDADGVRAWSECVAGSRPNYSPETIDTAWLAIREWIAPRALDRVFEGPEAVAPALAAGIVGHPMARAAVEMGCWALAAERRGEPLAVTLGGTRDRIETGISLGIQPTPEALRQRAEDALARGYRKVKMKVRPGADLRFVRAVREGLDPDAPLAVDANAAYTLDGADGEALRALDGFDLLMIEQPLQAGDLLRHARLQSELVTPLCLDESVDCPERAEDMLDLDAGRIVNVKPGRVGGFSASLRIHDLCADRGVPVWCGGMLESGVGRAHNVALASLPNFRLPGDLSPSRRYWERDIVHPEWIMSADGLVDVPRDRPGLGVEVDAERVEALTVRTETLRGSAASAPRSDGPL